METKKRLGVLTWWDEVRGFGFVSAGRNPDGTRRSWFLHHTGIEHIEEGGVPRVGAEVYFNEQANPKVHVGQYNGRPFGFI